jgi:hypothetical protein
LSKKRFNGQRPMANATLRISTAGTERARIWLQN